MRHFMLFATACALVLASAAVGLTAPASAEAAKRRAQVLEHGNRYLLARIARHQRETWRLQRLMQRHPTRTSHTARYSRSPKYRRWVLRVWRRRATIARRQVHNPPHEAAWRCLQRYEGGWYAHTGNGYYGGLQMDLRFQAQYGWELLRRKGPANRWTPLEQMWVAERAFRRGRGFYPWPNTARSCGLI